MCVGGRGGTFTIEEVTGSDVWMTFNSEEDYLLWREVEELKRTMPPEALEGRSEAQLKRLAPSFPRLIKTCLAWRTAVPV